MGPLHLKPMNKLRLHIFTCFIANYILKIKSIEKISSKYKRTVTTTKTINVKLSFCFIV